VTAISVVVPIHNEAAYLADALPRLLTELDGVPAETTVILAENGSVDGTAGIALDLAARNDRVDVIRIPEANYGAAMRAGFRAARTEWVASFDIDYFSGEFLTDGLAMADRADIVLASKRDPESDDRRSVLRRLGTFVFNRMLRWLFGSAVSDTHGMKLVRRTVIQSVVPFVGSTLDLFDTELVIRAERDGYRIVELPVTVVEERPARSGFLRRVPRTVVGLLRIRLRLWRER
jgi:glycosyltransferase involved in cell wall biosynthesis